MTIAFNYGGRQDLDSKKRISSFLPNVDLLIRTGNENRISNFILYQLAYAEIIFEKTF
ncbi:undecaprenyl diphosphate synthase family protein [bacterium]|nr:undecaprenyl diphosphate synthase family protein [bacterium]